MINIYRITNRADHDLIEYQGDKSDVDAISNLEFQSRPAQKGYDVNYYTWARDQKRKELLKRLEEYLRRNYQPTEIRLSLFPGSKSLPADRPKRDWKQTISATIRNQFKETGARVCGIRVILGEPQHFEEVEANQAVEYRIWIDPNWRPWLLTDFDCPLFLDGRSVSLEQIALRYPENAEVRRAIKEFTTRTTEELFDRMREFVKQVGELKIASGLSLSFSSEPTSASQAGFQTWYWFHDTNTALKLGKGFEGILAKELLEQNTCPVGLQSFPTNLQVVLLYPSDLTDRRLCRVSNWSSVIGRPLNILKTFVPDYEVPVTRIPYRLDAIEKAIKDYREILSNDRRVLVLFFIPPEWARDSDDPLWRDADVQTHSLSDRLHEVSRNGMSQCYYISPLDWTLAHHTKGLESSFTSAMLKGLFVLGCQHWTVARMPLDGRNPDEVAFVGLDAGQGPPRLAGTIFDGQGVWLGYHIVPCKGGGEVASSSELQQVVKRLLEYYEQIMDHTPHHLIVHRDGLLKDELTGFKALAKKHGFSFDLVEVPKSGAPRFYQARNKEATPSAGIAVGREEVGIAYLVNVHSVRERGILPAPKALCVRKVEGPTSLKTLAAQVFWLSRLHIGSFHRSASLPATTAYADTLADKKRKLRSEWGSVIKPPSRIPYFL